jgi:2-keto-4-pentenoate hydratase
MERQLAWRAARLEQGERPIGWKVAFSTPPALEQLDLEAPLVGFLNDRSLINDGSTVAIGGWRKPALEPEIAVHLGSDLPAECSLEETRAAIAGLGPALEVADLDVPMDQLEELVARDIFQRHVLLGPVNRDRAGGDANGITGRVFRDGIEAASTDDPQAAVGNLVEVTRHVANYLGAFGLQLAREDVIITGAVVPLIWVEPGEEVRFELSGLGKLTLNFAGDQSAR